MVTSDSAAEENIEMTRNQVYGVPLTKGTDRKQLLTSPWRRMWAIESPVTARGNNPQTSQDESYEYI